MSQFDQSPLPGEQDVLRQESPEESMTITRDDFMKNYVLDVHKEWEVDGKAAEWAPSTNGRPLHWGEEYRSMKLAEGDPQKSYAYSDDAQMAVSRDGKLIALATNMVIRVYNMADKDLKGELVGHVGHVSTMVFVPQVPPSQPNAQYVLLSQGAEDEDAGQDDTIITWYLDREGNPLNATAPFDVETLADKAISSISHDITQNHGLSEEAITNLRKDFLSALKTADTLNRKRNLTTFAGTFPSSFSGTFISNDGSRLLYTSYNETTQDGMRPPDSLPTIMVRSLTDNSHIATLQGHTDAIMWASFSPTNPSIIASAAWDGTYRIWDTSTPTCLHTIKPPKRPQNWSGAFSPDGQHVLLSGTDNVGIYSVSTGERLFSLTAARKHASWVRYLGWSPKGDVIALASGTEILLWEPFNKNESNKCSVVVNLSKDEGKGLANCMFDVMMEFHAVKWLDGEKLAVQASDGSWMVWDRARNWKWRFQRPKGVEAGLNVDACALVELDGGKEVFVTVDGDRTVRKWLLE